MENESVIRVTIKYTDNSKSFSQEFHCADAQPSAPVIKDCEQTTMATWLAAGNAGRNLAVSTNVRIRPAR
jgi:hypothetical protein